MIMIGESICQIWVKVRILAQECLRYIVQGCKKMYVILLMKVFLCLMLCHPFINFWSHGVVEFLHLKSEMFFFHVGLESRLREVCNDLLGPVYSTKGNNSWDKSVLVSIN